MQASLLILNFDHSKVWLNKSGDLPGAELPPHPAEVGEMAEAVTKLTGLEAVVLVCLEYTRDSSALYLCACLEPQVNSNLSWQPLEQLSPELFQRLNTWLSPGQQKLPWTHTSWHRDIRRWLKAHLPAAGFFPEAFRQHRSWSISSILMIPTQRGALYLKALPPLFAIEPSLVLWLTRIVPGQVPEVIISKPEKGWFMTWDFGGLNLGDSEDYELWQQALAAYARLQIKTIHRDKELLALGCLDRRLPRLIDHCRQLADYLDREARGGSFPQEDAEAWRSLLPRIESLAGELESLGIPYTLEHGDLHCGNIQITDKGFLFFDWTDGSLAHPFFSLVPFLAEAPKEASLQEKLVGAYLNEWALVLTGEDLHLACRIARVLALGHQTWSYYLINQAVQPDQLGSAVPALVRKTLKVLEEYDANTP